MGWWGGWNGGGAGGSGASGIALRRSGAYPGTVLASQMGIPASITRSKDGTLSLKASMYGVKRPCHVSKPWICCMSVFGIIMVRVGLGAERRVVLAVAVAVLVVVPIRNCAYW